MRARQSKKSGQNKRADTQNRKEHEALIRQQSLQRDPTIVQLVAPRLDNRENSAGEHGQERQPHQNKSRRRYVLPVPRAPKHQGGEHAEKHEEQTVAPKNLLSRKG